MMTIKEIQEIAQKDMQTLTYDFALLEKVINKSYVLWDDDEWAILDNVLRDLTENFIPFLTNLGGLTTMVLNQKEM